MSAIVLIDFEYCGETSERRYALGFPYCVLVRIWNCTIHSEAIRHRYTADNKVRLVVKSTNIKDYSKVVLANFSTTRISEIDNCEFSPCFFFPFTILTTCSQYPATLRRLRYKKPRSYRTTIGVGKVRCIDYTMNCTTETTPRRRL